VAKVGQAQGPKFTPQYREREREREREEELAKARPLPLVMVRTFHSLTVPIFQKPYR
jgi:hypothetical protein